MNERITEYCGSIGMGEPLIEQVRGLYQECQALLAGETIEDMFINEYVTEDGTREYDTLHFFTESLVIEVERFVSIPRIWITEIRVLYLFLEKKDFDFVTAKQSSRLTVRVDWLSGSFTLNLKASGDHCQILVAILRKHILPHVREQ